MNRKQRKARIEKINLLNSPMRMLKRRYPDAKIISSWEELQYVAQDSEEFYLKIDEDRCEAEIVKRDDKDSVVSLSPSPFHTCFYLLTTMHLQRSGFNVIIRKDKDSK